MKTLFTVDALLPCVGIAILLKQIANKATDFIPFFVDFTLAASLGLNLVACAVVSLIFAVLYYELEMIKHSKSAVAAVGAVAATWVSVKTSFTLGNSDEPYLILQEKLDSVYPGLLTA